MRGHPRRDPQGSEPVSRKQWRCFHCDAVFTSRHEAGIHFGADMAGTCACVLPHEQHLVKHIRDLQAELDRYRAEDSDVMRSIMTLEADHRQALIREEEKGYERGVRDMKAFGYQTEAA
jgi:hypothetical protein